MKIDYVIIGCDINPLYLDFWEPISKVWKTIFNITPVLGLICDEDSDLVEDKYGLVKKYKSIDNITTGLQSQIIRFELINELKGNLIISDIDMIPLSKDYFINSIIPFSEDKIYVLSSDNAECLRNKEYPMCYIIGNNENLKDMLNLNKTWVEFAKKLNALKLGWTTDQNYLFEKINEFKSKNENKVVLLNRGWNAGIASKRIDRIAWSYDENKVKDGYYIDSHLLRPYNDNKIEINKLINLISMENIDLYSTHLELLNKIFEIKGNFNNIVEFGMGNYSTPTLIDNSKNCISIEMQSEEWFNLVNLKFKDLKSWSGIKSIGPFGFYNLEYPEKIDLVFVDGHGDSRPECINFMIDKGCDIIVAHDTEQPTYGWDRIKVDNKYKRFDFKKHKSWTSLWTTDEELILKIQNSI